MQSTTPNREPAATIVDERLSFNVKIVGMLCVFLATSLGTFFALRGDVQLTGRDVKGLQEGMADMKTTMNGLRAEIDALKKLSNLEIQMENLRRNGSENLKEFKDKLDRLKEAFDLHVALTMGKEPDPPKGNK